MIGTCPPQPAVMKKIIRIAHLSDIHIGPSDEPVRQFEVRHNFERTLEDIRSEMPDLIVMGGDQAAHCGELDAYRWIKPHLDHTGIPYQIVPGNHDNIDNLDHIFNLGTERKEHGLYSSKRVNGLKLIFLDSSTTYLDRDQLEWLKKEADGSDEVILLFIHHPPLFCNCTFMDSHYPLQNREEAYAVMSELPSIQHIFCGHYHTEKTIRENEKNIYLTPSTMMQMSQDNPDYEVNETSPGWRIIQWNGSRLETAVRYIHPASTDRG